MSRSLRVDLDPADLGRGLAEIIIALLELLREVLERQALRRVDGGDLSDEQIERLGAALRDSRHQLAALREALADADARAGDHHRRDQS